MRRRARLGWAPWLVLGAALLPVVALAPRKPAVTQPETIEELAELCLATGATGRALADEASAAVARAFAFHSLLHLWEGPEAALRSHRGWSHQYNTVLLLLLRRLGFEARLVHAARVQGFPHPWWFKGHTWVKVSIDGHELDACASAESNRVGAVGSVPYTRELPMRRITRWGVALWMAPLVVAEVWSAWLRGRELSPWVYGPRGGRTPDSGR